MKAKILKKLTNDGKELEVGTIVDVSGWRNAKTLEGSRYITFVSEEEIKNDLYQQRIERAVGAELTNTATIITKTGIFDNIDKLYTQKTGTTSNAGSAPPPPGGAPPPPGGEAPMGLPENERKDNLKILLESDSLTEDDSFIDLSKAKNSLGEMEAQLSKLLNG